MGKIEDLLVWEDMGFHLCSSRSCSSYWGWRRKFAYGSFAESVIANEQTMPLMIIVFGNLVGDFSSASAPGGSVSPDVLQSAINKNT